MTKQELYAEAERVAKRAYCSEFWCLPAIRYLIDKACASTETQALAAVRTLEHAKYTYQDGAYLWKPPIGKSPFIQQEWQPISTAPKQAGLILLSDGYTTEAGSWYEEYGWMARREIYHPTHWMTLPLPAHKD